MCIFYNNIEQDKMLSSLAFSDGKLELLIDRYQKLSEIAYYYDIKNNNNNYDIDDEQNNNQIDVNMGLLKKMLILEKQRESKLNSYIYEKEKNEKIIKKLQSETETKKKYLKHL